MFHLVCWLDASKRKQWRPFVVRSLSVPDSWLASLFLGQAVTEGSFHSLCIPEVLFQGSTPLQSVFLITVLRPSGPSGEVVSSSC